MGCCSQQRYYFLTHGGLQSVPFLLQAQYFVSRVCNDRSVCRSGPFVHSEQQRSSARLSKWPRHRRISIKLRRGFFYNCYFLAHRDQESTFPNVATLFDCLNFQMEALNSVPDCHLRKSAAKYLKLVSEPNFFTEDAGSVEPF